MTAQGQRWLEKDRAARVRACLDKEVTHLRVGKSWLPDDPQGDGEQVTFVGYARDLHGPDGVCTCCHGRTAS